MQQYFEKLVKVFTLKKKKKNFHAVQNVFQNCSGFCFNEST